MLPGGRAESNLDVVLVTMPFHGYLPSLGLSLLKSCLTAQRISSKVLYFGLPFAQRMGCQLYHCIANGYPRPMDLLGEWIFSAALFDNDSSSYIDEVLIERSNMYADVVDHTIHTPDLFFDKIRELHKEASAFVAECAEEVLRYSPKVVGIGSVFHQQMSSLALARRIKAFKPDAFIVMGGGNCEGVMGAEVARQFPFVDAVVSGEAELVFQEIVRRILDGTNVSGIKGVYTSDNASDAFATNLFPSAQKVAHLDDLPIPDYADFFEQATESGLGFRRQVLYESSRGCWWGERSHCTFCGISPETMGYRSKSSDRALEEILHLSEKYNCNQVHVVDCILDLKYFKDFLPKLAERTPKLDIFYEVKANMKKEQVRILKDAGVNTIQPGIESFSNSILQLMGKGVSALQNIQLLKWCKELGVTASWNILWGFPGEDPVEYERMARLIPFLTHLPAPQAAARMRLDRFSPNFEYAQSLGISKVKPHPAYFHLYPFSPEIIANLAYFFVYDYCEERDVQAYTRALWFEVEKWWNTEGGADLFCVDNGSRLLIWDLRPAAAQTLTVLTGSQKFLYESCQTQHTASDLKRSMNLPLECDVESLLEPLVNRGLMVQDQKSYLSLAIPLGTYQPKGLALKNFCIALERMGQPGETEITLTIPEAAFSTAETPAPRDV